MKFWTFCFADYTYYEKKDSVNYIIYFTIGFDEAKIYYSETKKWVNKL